LRHVDQCLVLLEEQCEDRLEVVLLRLRLLLLLLLELRRVDLWVLVLCSVLFLRFFHVNAGVHERKGAAVVLGHICRGAGRVFGLRSSEFLS